MQISRQQVVDALKAQGDNAAAARAEASLPLQVDPENEEQRNRLAELGLDPDALEDEGEAGLRGG